MVVYRAVGSFRCVRSAAVLAGLLTRIPAQTGCTAVSDVVGWSACAIELAAAVYWP
jgi:hypothetical protein